MTENIAELLVEVDRLNNIFETADEDGQSFRPFTIQLDGNEQSVRFFDLVIWESVNDDRCEVVENAGLEPICAYLTRRINELMAKFGSVKV